MGEPRNVAGLVNDQREEQKEEVILKVQKTVHFATLMGRLKNAELERKYPKYTGRVVLRGTV